MDWIDVIKYLKNIGLLPSHPLEISSFAELEDQLLNYIYSLETSPSNIVNFDGECIESADSYTFLFDKFLRAMSNDIKLNLIKSDFNFENKTAYISAKKSSKLYEAKWQQDSDWVSEEFLDYIIKVTNNNKEVFFPLDTEDQTLLYICIDKKISSFLKKAKKDSEKSGAKYFISVFGSGGPAYGYEYLPRKKYIEIKKEFKDLFMHSDSIEIPSFKIDAIDVLIHMSPSSGTPETEEDLKEKILTERKKQNSTNLKLYALGDICNFSSFVPDTDSDIFTWDHNIGVYFKDNARDAFDLYGACNRYETSPALVFMAKDRKSGVIIRPCGGGDFYKIDGVTHQVGGDFYLIFLGTAAESIKNSELIKTIK